MKINRQIICSFIFVALLVTVTGISRAEDSNMSFVGHIGGWISDVTVSGDYAYVGEGQDLVVLDITDAANPKDVGKISMPGLVTDIAISGNYAYITRGTNSIYGVNGLSVVDISNPLALKTVGSYQYPRDYVSSITISGDYAYLACLTGLEILDISNPSTPIFVGKYYNQYGVTDVAVSGNYAYVATTYGVVIVDITDPTSPKGVGGYNASNKYVNEVAVSGNYAYASVSEVGLVILNITNSSSPTFAGSYACRAYDITLVDNYAYVADNSNGLLILDVTNSSSPTLVGNYAGRANYVTVSGNYAYVVADSGVGNDPDLSIIDITNKSSPMLSGTYDTINEVRNVFVKDNFAYIPDAKKGIIIIDITDTSSPKLAGRYPIGSPIASYVVSNNYAYLVCVNGSLVIVDISNPSSPKFVSSFSTGFSSGGSVFLEGNYAYLGYNMGLAIIDISNPSSPKLVGSYHDARYPAGGLVVSGDYAYVAYYGGLGVIDITNPSLPKFLCKCYLGTSSWSDAYDIAVAGNHAYVASDGLWVANITNSSSPVLESRLGIFARGIHLSGKYAYVSSLFDGLYVVDITNVSSPKIVAHYGTAGVTWNFYTQGDYVYVADERNGLVILKTNFPEQLPETVHPVANFTSNVTEGYVPLSVQFTDLSENATGWAWNFGDGFATYGQKNVTHVYDYPGLYNVTLTVSNSAGRNTTIKTNYINAIQIPEEMKVPSFTFGSPSSNSNGCFSDEPINLGTGSYFYQYQDLYIPGRGLPLVIARSYNSMDNKNGPFGSGWTFNYNLNLTVASNGDVTVVREDGHTDTYALNPDGTYSLPLNVFDTLVKNLDDTYTLTTKDQTKYNFSPEGKLINIIDKNGNQIDLTYTGESLTKVTDASGRELIFSYDSAGRIISITDPIGRVWSYSYDDNGNLIECQNPMGGKLSYTYDENHWMTSITDPRGNKPMTNTYDGEGRVISQSNALGAIYTFNYDTENRKTTETDPFGRTKVYTFDEKFWVLSETDPLGNTVSYAYDENGNRISVTNEKGQITKLAYDANGDITQITDPLGYVTSMTYDSKDNLISLTDALGHQTSLEYNGNSDITKIINALGNAAVFTYDQYGQIISSTDANGKTTAFGYNSNGDIILVTDALSNTGTFTYDAVGRLTTTTDANGNTYTLQYDDLDRLISITDPLGQTASNTYDAAGNRISFTDAAGSVIKYSYDPLNQLVKVTDAMGGSVSYTYDDIGNMVSVTDANGHKTDYAYDSLNRPVSITDPLEYATSTAYDAVSNRISFTDAEGSVTKYSYDPLNRLVEVTDAMGGKVQYTYDAVGNMVSMTDANGHKTEYIYDQLNRPISVIDPLGYSTSNTYDATGNIVSLTDANEKTTSYTYDGLNRLTQITYPDGQKVSYGYDAIGNRLTMASSLGTTSYEYDKLNRLLSVLNPDGQKVGYTYDAVGNRIKLTYPDGKMTSYSYDIINRLIGATDWEGHTTSYAYDANGNLISMSYPNGMKTEYSYDGDDRLVKLINKNETRVISSFEYTLDSVGNRLRVDEQFLGRFESEDMEFEGAQPLTTTYEYDNLYRLTKVNYPFNRSTGYSYDSMGNRISMITTINGTDSTIDYTYDAADRLLQSGNIIYSYDNNGNLIEKRENAGQVMSYSYDGANRLKSISTLYGTQRDLYNFGYDGDGSRISKTIIHGKSEQTTEYVLDVNSVLPQVLTESNNKDTAYYTYGTDLISMADPKRGEFYYHQDGLGSVRSLSDSKESVKTLYLYDAFGQIQKEVGHVDNDFLFTGEQVDDETGLIYLRARYYDPSIGRFITKDPFTGFFSNTQSLNRYPYVQNNPSNLVDPAGLHSILFKPTCLLYPGSCEAAEAPIEAGFTEEGTVVSYNLGVKGDIKELLNIKNVIGSVGDFVSISTDTPKTGFSSEINYGPVSADSRELLGQNSPEISNLGVSTDLDAGMSVKYTIVFRYPWNPPIDDFKLVGKTIWDGLFSTSEAHASDSNQNTCGGGGRSW
jgi:RHS repeat-associated protein